MATSFQADSMYGSGSITMHVDVQQAQKHRRLSSGSTEPSFSFTDFVSNPSILDDL